MRFSLDNALAKIVDVNPRAELHGQDPKPACDIKIAVLLSNAYLAHFHPELGGLLYKKNDGSGADLADQASDVMLRFPQLGMPLKWNAEIVGAAVTIHYGTSEKSNIVLPTCLVNEFRIDALEGGSVVLSARIQGHPDEKQFGKLCTLIGKEQQVTIAPPTADGEQAAELEDQREPAEA